MRLEQGDLCFGEKSKRLGVAIQAGKDDQDKWETEYLMDDRSLEDTALYFLRSEELVSWKPPDPQRAGGTPLQSSIYVLE